MSVLRPAMASASRRTSRAVLPSVFLAALTMLSWGAPLVAAAPGFAPAVAPAVSPAPTVTPSPHVVAVDPAPHAISAPVAPITIAHLLDRHPELRAHAAESAAARPLASAVGGTVFVANGTIAQGVAAGDNLAGVSSIAWDSARGTALVTGAYSSSIGDYEVTTGTISAFAQLPNYQGYGVPFPLEYDLTGVVDAPTTDTAYVVSYATGSVQAVDLASGSVVATQTFGAGGPTALAYDAGTDQLFVAVDGTNVVSILNATTLGTKANVAVGFGPDALDYDSASGRLFVANAFSNNVTVVDVLNRSSIASIPVGVEPVAFAALPAARTLWVANLGSENVTFLDTSALGSPGSLYLPAGSSVSGLVVDTARQTIYALDAPVGAITGINSTTEVLGTTYSLGGVVAGAVLDGGTGNLDYLDGSSNQLSVLDLASGSVTARHTLGAAPVAAVFDATTQETYVADATTDWIDVVNGNTEHVVGTIPLSAPAIDLVFASSLGTIAALLTDGNISFISASSAGVIGTWGPNNGTYFVHGAFGNGEFLFSAGAFSSVVFAGDIFVVSATLFTETRCIGAGSGNAAIAYNGASHYAYVAEEGELLVVSTVVNDWVSVIITPGGAYAISITLDTVANSLFFGTVVLGADFGNVSAWNLTSSSYAGGKLTGLHYPGSVDYVAATDRVYVTDYQLGEVIAIQEISGGASFLTSNDTVGTGPVGTGYSTLSGLLYVPNLIDGTLSLLAAGPSSVPLVASVTASPTSIPLGAGVTFSVVATYPEWADTVTWAGLPSGCTSANVTELTCVPTATGGASVTVTLRSPFGQTTQATVDVAVFAPLVFNSLTVAPAALTLGTSTTIAVAYSGGVAPVTVGYPMLPPGCSNTTSTNWTCTPGSSGTFVVEATLTDSVGHTLSTNTTLTVNDHLTIVSFTPDNANPSVGATFHLTVVLSGGTAPFRYSYTGLPATGCTGTDTANVTCAVTTAGVYPVLVSVEDASSVTATKPTNVVVTGAATANVGGLTNVELFAIIGAVVVVVLVGVFLATRRRPAAGTAGGPVGAPPPAPPADDEDAEEPVAPEGSTIVAAPPPERMVEAAPLPAPVKAPERYYSDPSSEPMPPPAAPEPGQGRAPIVCKRCGTVNEPWLTTCRKCQRALATTG